MKKAVFRLAASVVCLCAALLLAGFAPQDDAAKDMEEFSRAVLKGDTAGLEKFGWDKDAICRMEVEALRKSFEFMGRPFPEDLILRLQACFYEAAGKCEPRVRVLAADADKRTVEISFAAIDYRQIDMGKVMEGVLRSGDLQFKRRETMEGYADRLIAAFSALEPSERKRFQVCCVYDEEKGVWLPEAPPLFIHKLLDLASGGAAEEELGDPAKDIEKFARAYLRQDLSALPDLGLGKPSAAVNFHETSVKILAQKWKKEFADALTERQALRLAEATMQAIGRTDVKARTLHREGEFAEVELTVGVMEPFPQKEMAEVRKRVPPDASMKEAIGIFVDEMVSRLEQVQPSRTKTIQVSCAYSSVLRVWAPIESRKFLNELIAAPLAS